MRNATACESRSSVTTLGTLVCLPTGARRYTNNATVTNSSPCRGEAVHPQVTPLAPGVTLTTRQLRIPHPVAEKLSIHRSHHWRQALH
eukprot:3016411-Pyramimonas_sp.AAC.1